MQLDSDDEAESKRKVNRMWIGGKEGEEEDNPEVALVRKMCFVAGENTEDALAGMAENMKRSFRRLSKKKQAEMDREAMEDGEEAGVGDSTLLHLAAAMGYDRLACSLLQLAAEATAATPAAMRRELDPTARDAAGFTPLMRACDAGHQAAALTLYRWCAPALQVRNSAGESCLDRAARHPKLCAELGRLERMRRLNEASAAAKDRGAVKPGDFLRPGMLARKPCRAASLDGVLGQAAVSPSPSSAIQTNSSKSSLPRAPLRSASSSSCTMSVSSGGPTTRSKLRTSSPASSASSTLARVLRAASPSVQQPLSVAVGDEQQVNSATGAFLRRRASSAAVFGGGLSKRSSFDSGINMQQHERKDPKILPK